jgi:hypothetical protein
MSGQADPSSTPTQGMRAKSLERRVATAKLLALAVAAITLTRRQTG